MRKLVELKNVTIKAGERVILAKVSLAVKQTQCLIVEGAIKYHRLLVTLGLSQMPLWEGSHWGNGNGSAWLG